MNNFVKVKKLCGEGIVIDYGWMLKISNLGQLMSYHEMVGKERNSKAFSDVVKVEKGKKHYTDRLGFTIHTIAEIHNWSIVGALTHITSVVIRNQLESIEAVGAIYVNRNGGYFPYDENAEEYDRKNNELLVFPTSDEISEKDIRIIQWPNGNHFYAKIGNEDVVWEGEQKWNTKAEAKRAAEKYLGAEK